MIPTILLGYLLAIGPRTADLWFHYRRDFRLADRATENAIAIACLRGLPARISVLMFFDMVFRE